MIEFKSPLQAKIVNDWPKLSRRKRKLRRRPCLSLSTSLLNSRSFKNRLLRLVYPVIFLYYILDSVLWSPRQKKRHTLARPRLCHTFMKKSVRFWPPAQSTKVHKPISDQKKRRWKESGTVQGTWLSGFRKSHRRSTVFEPRTQWMRESEQPS